MATITGGAKLRAKLAELSKRVSRGSALKVGFLEGATYPDGTSVAMVAAVQNFGAPSRGIPPRPFFSNMVRDKQAEWGPALGRILERTDFDGERALALMGEGIAGQLRQSITNGTYAPNAMTTNILKQRFPTGGYGFSDVVTAWRDAAAGVTAPAGKPLVWSGDMLNAIDYEVS